MSIEAILISVAMGVVMSVLTAAYLFLMRDQFRSPRPLVMAIHTVTVSVFVFGAVYVSFTICDALQIPDENKSGFSLIWSVPWLAAIAFSAWRLYKTGKLNRDGQVVRSNTSDSSPQ